MLSCREKLLQDYEHKFEQLLEDQKLSKLCYDVGLKIFEREQFFITLAVEEGSDDMQHLCREYTLPRSNKASRARGWIRGNTKIGPVLDIKVCLHGVEIQVESLFQDKTASSIRIVNGIHQYVTETSETIPTGNNEHRETCCKATTMAYCDIVSYFYSYSWKKMDRH